VKPSRAALAGAHLLLDGLIAQEVARTTGDDSIVSTLLNDFDYDQLVKLTAGPTEGSVVMDPTEFVRAASMPVNYLARKRPVDEVVTEVREALGGLRDD